MLLKSSMQWCGGGGGGEEYTYHPSVPLPLVLYSNMIYEYGGVVLFINKDIYLNLFHIITF